MEVHHRSHGHGKKKFGDYLSEFLMIFLAVTAGFFAETFREHISDTQKEREYIHSLIADLKQDTSQIGYVSQSLFRNIKGQDSLIALLKEFKPNDSTVKIAYRYYLRYTIGVPQVLFNEGAITQLLASGNMRLITHDHVSDSIMDYHNMINYTKLQGQYYNEQFRTCFDFSTNIFDFSIAHRALKEDYTFVSTGAPFGGHLPPIKSDSLQLQKYANELTMLESIVSGYVLNLRATKMAAVRLMNLLRKEYDLEE